MATLIAYQNGDFTGATTFKELVGGAGSVQETITASTNTTTAYVSSSAFTVTNTHVIEGVMVHCRRLNTTGTVSVALSDDNGVTATREVTVDASDLPDQNSWVFFKFGTTLTGDGGADYKVMVKGSSANNAVFFRDATAGNWARLLRRDTTATIATTDVIYISGERTGAGSVTTVTVTMDQTATTSYGAMNIGDAGTVSFGTSASTNYYLRLAGNLNVWGNGTLNIGTSGTRIPSTSTATLEFNCASNVQFGLEAQNGSTVNIYGATKANTKVLLTADANSGQAVITVEDTTGWAVSDEVAIASTTRTPGQSEKRTISTVDSATQATMTANLGFTHQGTSPYQGEVINLTRNVKIRGTSTTLQSYVNCAATSSFTADNAEFFFLGSATANKQGINSATTSAGTFSMNGCALRDFTVASSLPLNITGASGSASITNNVVFHAINSTVLTQNGTFGTPTITGNWVLTTNTASVVFDLRDLGGIVTENAIVGGSNGYLLNESTIINTFSNNLAHSTNNVGINSGLFGMSGTISNCTAWRCSVGGFGLVCLTADGCSSYHNGTQNYIFGADSRLLNSSGDGGTGQSLAVSAYEILLNQSSTSALIESCNFGQTNTASGFVNLANSQNGQNAIFRNCNIAETLTIDNRNALSSQWKTPAIAFDKLNSTSGNHRAYKQFGYAGSDQSVYRTASPSEVLVPNSASGKLPSGSKKFGVASGNDATVSVWVRKSSTYNGAEPRLILKRNIVGGVSSDQVLATATIPMGAYDKPLDTYTGAAGAYSLRKLRSAYTGDAIRVRRSSDNTEQDIGFDANGHLDESALLSFVGAGNGFVRTWYDQSGNGRDAEQTTNANQPRIVNGGVVDKDKGRPTVRFDGTDDLFAVDGLASTMTGEDKPFSLFNAVNPANTNAIKQVLSFGNSGSLLQRIDLLRYQNDATNLFVINDDANNISISSASSAYSASTTYFNSAFSTGTAYELFRNGSSVLTYSYNIGTLTLNRSSIGALGRSNTQEFWNGAISELIFFASDQSANRVAIETNIDDYYVITPVWEELTASTPTVTDDCVLEVYVDCSATAGVVNIDDWAIS